MKLRDAREGILAMPDFPPQPPAVARGAFRAFFVYDVADTIDLTRLGSLGEDRARAPLQLRREASSDFFAFETPPVSARVKVDGGIDARVKVFDYGVVSIRLTIPFSGAWSDFAAFTRRMRNDEDLPALAKGALDGLLAEIAPALDDPHLPLIEDYFVFEVDAFERPVHADELRGPFAGAVASLVLCEDRALQQTEREEALRASFGFFEDDLTVVQWDTAFVYDRPAGAGATEDILEFANTQLAELRTYDGRLDAELDTIYKLGTARFRRKAAQNAADRLRYLIVDVLELTDRSGNALKIIGDAYYARLYRGAIGRLGLKDWQRQIDSKLASVNEMYRFFTDQAERGRSEFLEFVVILLIALELIVGVLALRH